MLSNGVRVNICLWELSDGIKISTGFRVSHFEELGNQMRIWYKVPV